MQIQQQHTRPPQKSTRTINHLFFFFLSQQIIHKENQNMRCNGCYWKHLRDNPETVDALNCDNCIMGCGCVEPTNDHQDRCGKPVWGFARGTVPLCKEHWDPKPKQEKQTILNT